MGLFERLGRKVQKLKREAEAASEGSATHGCTHCETLLYTDHDECPECGADAVRALADE
jgi:rRNA maturation endonuclease Nob1